jgi:hypothetical protein
MLSSPMLGVAWRGACGMGTLLINKPNPTESADRILGCNRNI